MKRLLLLLITALPFSVRAQSFTEENNDGIEIVYSIISETDCEVMMNYPEGYQGDIRIPSSVSCLGKTYNVTGIGDNAFSSSRDLSSVSIPEGVTYIGESAFCDCSNLNTLILPSTLLEIKDAAFSSCSSLSSLNLPDKVVSIGNGVCSFCTSLLSVNIPSGISRIGDLAFCDCSSLSSIALPENVQEIGFYAFSGCSLLSSVNLPDGITCISDGAFDGCSLTSVEIPNGVVSIGAQAFDKCPLTSISIPQSVSKIGSSAFYCPTLEKAEFASIEQLCSIDFEDEHSNPLTLAHRLFINGDEVSTVVIPNSVTKIGKNSFCECSSIVSVEMTNNVSEIAEHAFFHCQNLTSVDIPEGITVIRRGTFQDCISLSSVKLPNSLITIDDYAFFQTVKLNSLVIPDNVKTIGERAFWNSSLITLFLGEKLETIGDACFMGCNLFDVRVSAIIPPLANLNSFENSNLSVSVRTLYVPKGCKEKFEAAEEWKNFGAIIEMTDDVTITEGDAEYTNLQSKSDVNITYTRNFGNTKWQSLYVPFSMHYEDWKDNYEVAYINSVRQYDNDNDGAVDETIMDIIKINGGELYPNMPYLIKAKATGLQDIVAENATLSPTEENSISCSTMLSTFTFTGTYSTIPAATLLENNYYAMGGGTLIMTNGASNLKPFRWYMSIESRSSMYDSHASNPAQVRLNVIGEEDEMETSLYQIAREEEIDQQIFNLNGQPVKSNVPGFYIKNGKKIIIR